MSVNPFTVELSREAGKQATRATLTGGDINVGSDGVTDQVGIRETGGIWLKYHVVSLSNRVKASANQCFQSGSR